MINDELRACYCYYQKTQGVNGRGNRAACSLERARQDIAAGNVRRYASVDGYGPRFEAYGESHMRWMENPEAAGLRLVGYADELSPHVNHTGWYTDSEYSEGCARGVVYRLPARKGREAFAYGYADPENEGAACLCFDVERGDSDHARGAAHWADGIAKNMAEQESEYQEAWRAGRDYDDANDAIGVIRRSTLALIKEIKALCPSPDTEPAIYATLREGVMSELTRIRELRKKRADWLENFGDQPGFVE